ncbi:MAG: hypothetical protein ACYC1K_01365 [Minisyncoccota bacterium]
MDKELIGQISGALVILSAVPYVYGLLKGRNDPEITSWSLWSVIGLSLLLTYKSSGAESNIWPAVFGFTNPIIITVIAIVKKGERRKLNRLDWACVVLCVIALSMWLMVRTDKQLAQYALYLSIFADACAAIPTIALVWSNPMVDRPFAWGFFGIGYSLGLLAVPDTSFSNMILPVYMFVGSWSIMTPLVLVRIKNRVPLKEWI